MLVCLIRGEFSEFESTPPPGVDIKYAFELFSIRQAIRTPCYRGERMATYTTIYCAIVEI